MKTNCKVLTGLLLTFAMSGCFLIAFVGDRLSYRFTGTISSSQDSKGISSVHIIASCAKTRLEPPVNILSDREGKFLMEGYFYGALDDCHLSFHHIRFKSKVIKLKPARELTEDTGFVKVWMLDVEMEPV